MHCLSPLYLLINRTLQFMGLVELCLFFVASRLVGARLGYCLTILCSLFLLADMICINNCSCGSSWFWVVDLVPLLLVSRLLTCGEGTFLTQFLTPSICFYSLFHVFFSISCLVTCALLFLLLVVYDCVIFWDRSINAYWVPLRYLNYTSATCRSQFELSPLIWGHAKHLGVSETRALSWHP